MVGLIEITTKLKETNICHYQQLLMILEKDERFTYNDTRNKAQYTLRML